MVSRNKPMSYSADGVALIYRGEVVIIGQKFFY